MFYDCYKGAMGSAISVLQSGYQECDEGVITSIIYRYYEGVIKSVMGMFGGCLNNMNRTTTTTTKIKVYEM